MNIKSLISLFASVLILAGCKPPEKPPTTPPPPVPKATTQPSATLPPGHPPLDSATPAMPPGHPSIDMSKQTLPAGTVADVANPKWDVPKNWEEGPASSVRRASYVVKGENGQAVDIAVTVFPGDVGGMEANINRWRGQLGLAAGEQTTSTALDVNGQSATLVDLKNEATGKRMLVATVPNAGNSWFFKMNGDAALVEAQKEAFLDFVKSVKF